MRMLLELIFIRDDSFRVNLPCFHDDVQFLISHLSSMWFDFILFHFFVRIYNKYKLYTYTIDAGNNIASNANAIYVTVQQTLLSRLLQKDLKVVCAVSCICSHHSREDWLTSHDMKHIHEQTNDIKTKNPNTLNNRFVSLSNRPSVRFMSSLQVSK